MIASDVVLALLNFIFCTCRFFFNSTGIIITCAKFYEAFETFSSRFNALHKLYNVYSLLYKPAIYTLPDSLVQQLVGSQLYNTVSKIR